MIRTTRASAAERVFEESLQVVAEGLAKDVRFGVVVVATLDDDGMLNRAALAGERADPDLRGLRYPVSELERELGRADTWGLWRFVPHDRTSPEEESDMVVPEMDPATGPNAWHPMDLLFAPLHDDDGELQGAIVLDVPLDGRRPGADQRGQLDGFARRANRAVVAAVERRRLRRLTELNRRIRRALREINDAGQLQTMLAQGQPLLTEAFEAAGSWLHLGERPEVPGDDRLYGFGEPAELPPDVRSLTAPFADTLWAEQATAVVGAGTDQDSWLDPAQRETVRQVLDSLDLATALFVPLGSGSTALGHLLLTREDPKHIWTQEEQAEALDLGHDLGAAIVRTRVAEREAQLVRELRDLHLAKDQLMDTVTHDLRNPLAALDNLLHRPSAMPELPVGSEELITSISQVSRRMRRLTDQLLALSRATRDGGGPSVADLVVAVDETVEVVRVIASEKGVELLWEPPSAPLLVTGEPVDVGSIVANLVGNAVTYTPTGGRVTVEVESQAASETVVLSVHDTGLGIAEEDRERIFAEFDRSTNPTALKESGTGLGLAIVRALAARTGATISLDSQVGRGSTFTVAFGVPDDSGAG